MGAASLVAVTVPTVLRIVGLALLGGTATAVLAAVHRWYARERLPVQLGVLTALGVAAISLNTAATLTAFVGGGTELFRPQEVVTNGLVLATTAAGGLAATGLGDRAGVWFGRVAQDGVEGGIGTVVRSVGRTLSVEIPDDIDDVEGYDPVDDATTASLAGSTMTFPRGLTVSELQERIAAHLRDDYGVGAVDVEVEADGTVRYLAIGSRVAGVGPTLAPGTVAVPARGDPAHGNGAGDRVQLWQADGEPERVVSGELRGAHDDVVTVAVDEDDADAIAPDERYRVVTLPAEVQPDRAFAGLLRAAEETMHAIAVEEGATLDGTTVGAVDGHVVAVESAGDVDVIPASDRVVGAGDVLYVVAVPAVLRRLEAAASTADASDGPAG